MMHMTVPARRWRAYLPRFAMAVALLAGTAGQAFAAVPNFPPDAPWFNVSRPLTDAMLKGRLVLLDFFTPGCINCIHTLPDTARLEHEFDNRLIIIGVNSPKFTASQQSGAIEGFIRRYDIRHPIVTDKDMRLWRQYGVFAWPTFVLLDPDGHVAGRFIGEGQYPEIRRTVIKTLASARKAGTLDTVTTLPLRPPVMPDTPLLQPGKVAAGEGFVAVSDTGHNRIVLLHPDGQVAAVVGDGQPGDVDGPPAQARFDGPQGLAFDGHWLYVADTDNQLIRRIDLKGFGVSTVAGDGGQAYNSILGDHPAREVSLNSPWGLRLVGDKLYIAMAGDHQVWRLNLASGRIGPYAGSGAEGIDDGSLEMASFAQSSGLAYHDGKLYVSDPEASAIREIDLAQGTVRTLVGKGLFDFGLRDGPAGQALLQHDQGLVYHAGRLYIADTFNNAIRVLDLATDRMTTLAKGFAQPGGLAWLSPDRLLVANTNANDLVTVDTKSGQVQDWSLHGLSPPSK